MNYRKAIGWGAVLFPICWINTLIIGGIFGWFGGEALPIPGRVRVVAELVIAWAVAIIITIMGVRVVAREQKGKITVA